MIVELLIDNIFIERLGLRAYCPNKYTVFVMQLDAAHVAFLFVRTEVWNISTIFSLQNYLHLFCLFFSPSSLFDHYFMKQITARTYLQLPLRQCLPLSVVQRKGKHCRKSHCRNRVVDTFGQGQIKSEWIYEDIDFPNYHLKYLKDFYPETWGLV